MADAGKTEEAPVTPSMSSDSTLRCRFYSKKYPENDELVMVNVKSIADMGAYVTLLEYNDIEGMIMYSELSRRRIRSINKLIRVGKNEVVMVIRVDQEKGYIDLSKRRVAPEDVYKCEDRYEKAKSVHSILRHVAAKQKVSLESLYECIGWPLYEKFGHAYEGFRQAVRDPTSVFEGLTIADNVMESLMSDIKRKMTPQPIKVRADIQVRCFTYDGIDAIRAALLAGEAMSTEDCSIKVKLIAPPLYVMLTTSLDQATGIKAVNDAIDAVRTKIESYGGSLAVKVAPRVTTQRDESELTRKLQELQADNEDEVEEED